VSRKAPAYEVRVLRSDELEAAAACTARALQDDPPMVASYGDDVVARVAAVHELFADVVVGQMSSSPQFGAVAGRLVVGVAAASTPGHCVGDMMRPMAEQVLAAPVAPMGDPMRAWVFWATWAAHDLLEPHRHIGPVGVEPGFQGGGIGGAVMRALCADLDDSGEVGWLETSKERNVRFYSALGFEVVDFAEMLGVPNWFMRRDPGGAA